VRPGEWLGDLKAARTSQGSSFSPATDTVIDDDGIGKISMRPASDFCLDVSYAGNLEVWGGTLSGGRHVVAMLNRSPVVATFTAHWSDLGIPPGSRLAVRDVWQGTDSGIHVGNYTAAVPAHGVTLLVLG